jgi:hypothetical protein
LLAKAEGPQKNYRLTKRHRGQARSYTVIRFMLRDRVRRKSRRRRLAGEVGGSAKKLSTDETSSRASALLHRPTFMLPDRVRRKSRRSRLAGEGVGSAKIISTDETPSRASAPTPSYIHAARSRAPQIRRSRLAGEAVGQQKNVDGRNAIAGKRAPTPSYIHAERSRAPQIPYAPACWRSRWGREKTID